MAFVQKEIISFIKENFIVSRSDTDLTPELSLLESGVIDSTGVLELAMF